MLINKNINLLNNLKPFIKSTTQTTLSSTLDNIIIPIFTITILHYNHPHRIVNEQKTPTQTQSDHSRNWAWPELTLEMTSLTCVKASSRTLPHHRSPGIRVSPPPEAEAYVIGTPWPGGWRSRRPRPDPINCIWRHPRGRDTPWFLEIRKFALFRSLYVYDPFDLANNFD